MEFDAWLRTELKHRGWTLTEFGRRIGVSVAAVSRWAKGQRRPDVESIPRIAAELGVSPETVFNMAGYRVPERTPVEGLRRQIGELRAERETLQHERQHLGQRLDELEQRIVEAERLEQEMASERPSGRMGRTLQADPFVYFAPFRVRSAALDRELDVAERQYREEWSTLERASFARGVELGIRAASLLSTKTGLNK